MRAALIFLAVSGPATLAAGEAQGGGVAGGPPSGCTTCQPACCVAPTHQVKVPGITVVPPTIYIAPGKITAGVGLDQSINVSVEASSSAEAYASSLGSASSFSYANGLATANAQAQNLLAAGGGSYFSDQGNAGGNIPSLIVASPETTERKVCVERAAVAVATAIQAVCLDDKAVPHPASQVMPGRDVADGYAGELFRCLAGSHMQYVTTAWKGEARFDHGQTVVCQKGDALWRGLDGRLQCKPQAPARDCNERSLLRRYGAGIKVVKAMAAEQCVRWSTETVTAETTSAQSFAIDGGVGG